MCYTRIKTLLISVFIVYTFHVKAQTTKYSNIGAEVGVANMFVPQNNSAVIERNFSPVFNLNYLFTAKIFCLKINAGVIHTASFNNVINGTIEIGLTTNVQKKFSWNFLIGINRSSASETYNRYYKDYYIYQGRLLCAETNFLFNPLKSKQHLFGFGLNISRYTVIQTVSYKMPDYEIFCIPFKLSYYFRIEHDE